MGVWPSVVDKGTFFTWKACHAVNKEGKIQNTNTQARESVAKNLQENARTMCRKTSGLGFFVHLW